VLESHSFEPVQVDQGLGWGTWVALFNRHQLAMTRFLPLGSATMHPPPVVVLHTRYGGCIGDVPSYRSFTSGGPYSLRGHNTGELANHSRFLEVLAKLFYVLKCTITLIVKSRF
jgi:outer membrane protein assembly factor BamA